MASGWSTQEGASLTRPPGFNGKDYAYWKERMRIFIEGVDIEVWESVVNGPYIPMHLVNGILTVKERIDWNEEDKRKVQHNLRAKNIITSALSPDEFFRISNCKTAQEMWDNLQVTHEGTSEVKRARTNTLIREYELFRMNPGETVQEMQKRFTHIVNQLCSLGKVFPGEDLINKVLRCLSREWQPKVTAISESRNLATMTLATLFGKLQEHELELSRLAEHEDDYRKKKSLALKAASSSRHDDGDDSQNEDDEDMALMVRKFKRFMRKGNPPQKSASSKWSSNKENSSGPPTCYECGKPGHIKVDCPSLQRKESRYEKKGSKGNKGKKAYVAWEDNDMNSSDDAEDEEAHLALMANHGDESEGENEVSSNSETSHNAYDELHEAFLELHSDSLKLAKALTQSKKAVDHLQKQVIALTKERLELRKENYSLGCFKANYVCDNCIEHEKKIHELEWTIEKMSKVQHAYPGSSRNNFVKNNVHSRSPRNNSVKRHVHHKSKFVARPYIKCYHCAKPGHTASVCTARNRQVVKKVWVPKKTLPSTNPQGPKEIWVPKPST